MRWASLAAVNGRATMGKGKEERRPKCIRRCALKFNLPDAHREASSPSGRQKTALVCTALPRAVVFEPRKMIRRGGSDHEPRHKDLRADTPSFNEVEK